MKIHTTITQLGNMMLIPRISRRFWVKENDVGIYLECIGNALYAFSRWPWLLDPWRQSMDTITWPQQNLASMLRRDPWDIKNHEASWDPHIYIIYYITHIQYIIYTHNITYESSLDEALWNKSWAKLIQQNLPFSNCQNVCQGFCAGLWHTGGTETYFTFLGKA